MKTENHKQYRALFYFFMYAFASRGKLLAHDSTDPDNLLNVIHQLAVDPDDFHFRHEHIPPQPTTISRKSKVLVDNDPAAPMPPCIPMSFRDAKRFKKQRGFWIKPGRTVLYTATEESQFKYLMLNNEEYLKTKNGRTWNDYINLYRSLLVYDLYESGETLKSISVNYARDSIGAILYEFGCDRLSPFERIEEISEAILQRDLIDSLLFKKIYSLEAEQVMLDSGEPLISNYDNTDDESNPFFNRVKSHYDRALQLIHLAETGQFKTFPSVLSPLK